VLPFEHHCSTFGVLSFMICIIQSFGYRQLPTFFSLVDCGSFSFPENNNPTTNECTAIRQRQEANEAKFQTDGCSLGAGNICNLQDPRFGWTPSSSNNRSMRKILDRGAILTRPRTLEVKKDNLHAWSYRKLFYPASIIASGLSIQYFYLDNPDICRDWWRTHSPQ
jgi:hypothetical protein